MIKGKFLNLIRYSTDNPLKVIVVYLVITIGFLIQFPKVIIDTDPENMLKHTEEVRVTHDLVKKSYDLYDIIAIGVVDDTNENGAFTAKTLNNVSKIVEDIKKIKGVIARDIMSPTTSDDILSGGGMINIEPLSPSVVKSDKQALAVRDNGLKNPILKDSVVSGDGLALAIYVPIKEKKLSYEIANQISVIIESHKGVEDYHIAGLPISENTFGVEMFKQMGISAPMAGALIFILMVIFFRKPLMVSTAMVVAMFTVIWAMGLLIGMGFTVHIMSSMIAIFLMPIAVLDSIHILSDFSDRFKSGDDKKETIMEVMDELFTPMFFTSLTSAIGFISLMLTPIPPVKVFGGFIAFGIIMAWLLSITLIPALIMLIDEKRLVTKKALNKGSGENDFMRTVQEGLQHFSIKYGKVVIAVSVIVVAVGIFGITKTTVNDNPVKWFNKDHPIRIADKVMNSHFGGTYMSYLVLESTEENSMTRPENLKYIESLQRHLEKIDVVGKTTSIVDVVKKVSQAMFDDDEAMFKIPETQKQAGQFLFMYEMSGDANDLYHMVTPGYDSVNIWVQLTSGNNKDMLAVTKDVEEYFKSNPLPSGVSQKWAGLTYLNVVWQDKMVTGMLKSLASGAVLVFIVMVMLYRSIAWAVLSMIPLTVTIISIYGLIGYIGKDYDMPIAVLSALTLGISIDFAIHLCQRVRQIASVEKDWHMVFEKLYDEPVRAIIRNALVISIGFTPLLFSPLLPYKTVGVFFAAIMAVSGAVTLILMPALIDKMRASLKL